jgi:hypothetical protein
MHFEHDPARHGWAFETAELSGFLLPDGQRHGVKTLVHKPTGLEVVHPDYDVLNLFLLFSTNLCLGTAREKDRQVQQIDGGVRVTWPPTDDHRAELIADYLFKEPNIIDLVVTIRSNWPYPAYELFLSNYFDPTMRPYVYLEGSPYASPPDVPTWVAPEVNEVFVGTGLVFPRDQHASQRSVDGRWNRIWALYQWNPQRYYEEPVLFQSDPEQRVAAVLMSRREDCFAVICGYDSPNLEDPFKSQNPLYLSLFGDDLVAGSVRTVKARLQVLALDGDLDRVLAAYERFAAEG